jgi:hypothetical protein
MGGSRTHSVCDRSDVLISLGSSAASTHAARSLLHVDLAALLMGHEVAARNVLRTDWLRPEGRGFHGQCVDVRQVVE